MISNISAITNISNIPNEYLNYLKYSKDQILNPFGNLCPSSNNLNNESVCPCIQKHTKKLKQITSIMTYGFFTILPAVTIDILDSMVANPAWL